MSTMTTLQTLLSPGEGFGVVLIPPSESDGTARGLALAVVFNTPHTPA